MARVFPAVLIGALLLLGLAGLVLFGGSGGFPGLDRSVIGVEALTGVLERAGVEVARSDARLSPRLQDLSLRILPLYDMDLTQKGAGDRGADATTLRDLDAGIFWQKLRDLPTLVVLPKWRASAASEAVAAPQTMIPVADYRTLLDQIGLDGITLRRNLPVFQTQDWAAGRPVTLFAPQVFDWASLPLACDSRVSFGSAVLVAECHFADGAGVIWFLSDPDLLNNHGLTLGENAAAAVTLAKVLRTDLRKPVYLDTSLEILTADARTSPERRDYQRSGSDLARFFAPPFTALWAMLLIVLALLLWRGALRFGPVRGEEEGGVEHSKSAAIATRARLLRLSGHDAQMVADFVQSDLKRVAEETFGRGRGESARLFALLARRDPAQAASFRAVAETLMQDSAKSPADLTRLLSTYRNLLESLTHGPDASRLSNSR